MCELDISDVIKYLFQYDGFLSIFHMYLNSMHSGKYLCSFWKFPTRFLNVVQLWPECCATVACVLCNCCLSVVQLWPECCETVACVLCNCGLSVVQQWPVCCATVVCVLCNCGMIVCLAPTV